MQVAVLSEHRQSRDGKRLGIRRDVEACLSIDSQLRCRPDARELSIALWREIHSPKQIIPGSVETDGDQHKVGLKSCCCRLEPFFKRLCVVRISRACRERHIEREAQTPAFAFFVRAARP